MDHTKKTVTCHPAEVRIPPLPPTEAGSRFSSRGALRNALYKSTIITIIIIISDPGGMQGSVDLCYVKADLLGIEPTTCQSQVQRPTAAQSRIKHTTHWSHVLKPTNQNNTTVIRETDSNFFSCFRCGPRAPSRRTLRKVTLSTRNLRGESVPISTRDSSTPQERYSRQLTIFHRLKYIR